MTTNIKQIIIIFLMTLYCDINANNITPASHRINSYIHFIKNKNVAIISNQTSVIHNTHIVDTLIQLKIKVKKVFAPEHGFRGEKDAGEIINDNFDKKTGLPIISLYGKNKKPTKFQLENIDVILFDIQDVGVRFYTYLSTLHYVMEAAAENNIPVIVLDRPNPNNHYIDGPVLKKEFSSFVGLHPVPIVYAMTIGEYAKMINGENWIKKKCDLTVIKMKDYSREQEYQLPIKPSPNLPNTKSINLYPSLCLFEGTNVSVGRGTDIPFQQFGSPFLKGTYNFVPKSKNGSKNPKHKGLKCNGTNLQYLDIHLNSINLNWLINCYNETTDKEKFFNSFFDKLAGTNQLRNDIISGKNESEIKKSWQKDLKSFLQIRQKYLIYK